MFVEDVFVFWISRIKMKNNITVKQLLKLTKPQEDLTIINSNNYHTILWDNSCDTKDDNYDVQTEVPEELQNEVVHLIGVGSMNELIFDIGTKYSR